MSTVTVKLPPRFYWDHVERGLPGGKMLHCGKTQVTVELDLDAYNDLRSDALYYSDSSQFDAEYRGLSASARATYRQLVAVGPPIHTHDWAPSEAQPDHAWACTTCGQRAAGGSMSD